MASPERVVYDCTACGARTFALRGTARLRARRCAACFTKRRDTRTNALNDLTGAQWARASCSVETYPDQRSDKQRDHGAAFPLALAEQQIRLYTQRGQTVLDPFVGVGTTLEAAHALGRRGVGIELSPNFAAQASADLPEDGSQTVHVGDCRAVLPTLPDALADLVVTSPPYADLLHRVQGSFADRWHAHSTLRVVPSPRPYSDAPEDLGNLDHLDYLDALQAVLAELRRVVRPDGYAVFVVKDFRALEQGVPFVPLHAHLMVRAERAGWTLWDHRIWDQTRFRSLVCLGYPSRNLYLNLGHSHLVVLRNQPPPGFANAPATTSS